MLAAERRQRILQDIINGGTGAVADLSQRYNVSDMTIRRDLEVLEKQGHVSRTHGGAIGRGALAVEPHYAAKQNAHAREKAAIAQYAAEHLVADNDIIILEGGTTVTTMARHLGAKQGVTAVTNGLFALNELVRLMPHTAVISTGGIVRDVSLTFVGPVVVDFFHTFHAHKVFISATGLTLDAGLMDPNMLEAQAKRAMIAAADSTIVLLDSSKFGVRSLTTVLPLDDIGIVITDSGAPEVEVELLRARGVDVRIAPLNESVSRGR